MILIGTVVEVIHVIFRQPAKDVHISFKFYWDWIYLVEGILWHHTMLMLITQIDSRLQERLEHVSIKKKLQFGKERSLNLIKVVNRKYKVVYGNCNCEKLYNN